MYRVSLRSLHLLGTCAGLLGMAAPALASETGTVTAAVDAAAAPDDASLQAQARFELALAAYHEGRLRAAIEHFKEADRLAPSARISFNIAKAYDRVDDAPNALAAYRDYLRRLPGAENAADTSLRIAELELALQRSGVQQVSVLSEPPGATVLIDGVSRGVTPWTGELPPGPHALSLRLSDHVVVERDFELPPRHAIDLVVALQPVRVPVSAPIRVRSSTPPAAAEHQLRAVWPTPARASPSPRWWTWTLLGSSAALLASAGVVELSRRGLESEIERTQDQLLVMDRYRAMEDRVSAARVLLGLGLAAGALGGVSLYLDLSAPSAGEPGLALGCDLGSCGGFARGLW